MSECMHDYVSLDYGESENSFWHLLECTKCEEQIERLYTLESQMVIQEGKHNE